MKKGRRQVERQFSCQEGLDHYPNEVGLKCAVSGQGIGRRRKLPYAGVIAVIRHWPPSIQICPNCETTSTLIHHHHLFIHKSVTVKKEETKQTNTQWNRRFHNRILIPYPFQIELSSLCVRHVEKSIDRKGKSISHYPHDQRKHWREDRHRHQWTLLLHLLFFGLDIRSWTQPIYKQTQFPIDEIERLRRHWHAHTNERTLHTWTR